MIGKHSPAQIARKPSTESIVPLKNAVTESSTRNIVSVRVYCDGVVNGKHRFIRDRFHEAVDIQDSIVKECGNGAVEEWGASFCQRMS